MKATLTKHSRSSKLLKAAAQLAAAAIPLVLTFTLASCTFSSDELEYSRGEKAAQAGDHEAALKHYRTLVDRSVNSPIALKAAKEAARLTHYELKRFKEAIDLYKHIVLHATNQADRIDAQKKIAEIHFNQTLDYNQAIIEYSRLIDLPHSRAEDLHYRLAIARSYFYLNNFFQSQVEIDRILAGNHETEELFDALLLKANIFLTTKRLDDAVVVLKELMSKYPEKSKNETIGLVLAVCYEEKKDFAKAIETLESIKNIYPRKAFIENRIKTLKERQTYLPGAKGWRK